MPKEDTNEKILGLLLQALQPIASKLDSLQSLLDQIWLALQEGPDSDEDSDDAASQETVELV